MATEFKTMGRASTGSSPATGPGAIAKADIFEGPGTSFAITNKMTGSLAFNQGGGLPNGEVGYFSLDEHFDAINDTLIVHVAANAPTATPEPASLVLAGIGGACLLARHLRRRKVSVASSHYRAA